MCLFVAMSIRVHPWFCILQFLAVLATLCASARVWFLSSIFYKFPPYSQTCSSLRDTKGRIRFLAQLNACIVPSAMRLKWSYKVAEVFGIPIRVHITVILLIPLLARSLGTVNALIVVGTALIAISTHELAHSLVALRKGCGVHDILLTPIGGVARMESIPEKPMDEFLMASAGPIASLLLAALLAGIGYLVPDTVLKNMARLPVNIIQLLGFVNLGFAIFNLIPAFPMDGGRILRAWLTPRLGRLRATFIAATIGKAVAVVFFLLGIRAAHWTLILIAVFVYFAAGREYRSIERQDRMKSAGFPFGDTPGWQPGRALPLDEVEVSPPPYSRPERDSTVDHGE